MMDRDPSVYKSNRLYVVIFWFFLYWNEVCSVDSLKWWVITLKTFNQLFVKHNRCSCNWRVVLPFIALRASQCDETLNPNYFSKAQKSLGRKLKEARTSTQMQMRNLLCENPMFDHPMSICLNPRKVESAIWYSNIWHPTKHKLHINYIFYSKYIPFANILLYSIIHTT